MWDSGQMIIGKTHLTLLFSTLKRPEKHLIELFRLMVNPFFLKGLKIEFLQSRSFFGLTIDVTCFCFGIYQVYFAEIGVFSKYLILKVRNGVFRIKTRFIQKRDPGLFQNKVMLPIFKRKM